MSSKEYYQANKEQWKKYYLTQKLKSSFKESHRLSTRMTERRASPKKRQRYLDNKFMFMRQLGGKCEICEEKDFRTLQFDHVNPVLKTHNISAYFSMKDLTKAFNELHNCRLLCANCHAIITYESGRLKLGKKRVEDVYS